MALPDQQHIFDSYPSPKPKLMEIAFLRNRRMHPKFVLAYLQLGKFRVYLKNANWLPSRVFSGILGMVSLSICYIILVLCGFFCCWPFGIFFGLVFHFKVTDKKGNVVLMQTRVRFFSGAKTNNIVVKHMYTRILERAWSVWSGCEMTCFCYITGTKIIYSVHKHYFKSTWLWDFDWLYFVDLN